MSNLFESSNYTKQLSEKRKKEKKKKNLNYIYYKKKQKQKTIEPILFKI